MNKKGEIIMAFKDFMNKVRYWDTLIAKWLMRHFYFMFFQVVLAVVFLFWLVNALGVIDISVSYEKVALTEKILSVQAVSMTIIVLLLLLNSFWMLYIFNSIQRIINVLKDINYNTNKLRYREK